MWYAAMAQLVEHILGKDEVPGPNPGSSSRQPRSKRFGALVFYKPLQTLQGRFCFLGVVWGCYSRFVTVFRDERKRNPVRIPAEERVKLVCKRQGEEY